MTTINFHASKEDALLIRDIVSRFTGMHGRQDMDRLGLHMDLAACHNTNPLKLGELVNSHVSDFTHDVTGIQRHIDRRTGQLEDGFSPRYSA